ncbi:SEC14-like protein 5 [Zingiber officinale]|uniref:CRAL-TRIO domain-containing protein n=1 Tax=Zingiber officinale TaxID=94328 RepID=A0A8J5I4N8_ZINOF|nr:SEC14-like protein 5 [Zingiber officinale]XP_042431688.1 SEC14-like protein 5 [Zingiber officinale]KAG6535554.1 hypothetical protein ZIOFF_000576 [Zingiber officinale]
MSDSSKNSQSANSLSSKSMHRKTPLPSTPGSILPKAFKHMVPYNSFSQRSGPTAKVAIFILKVAALEAVRRFAKARCSFIWKTIQSLQILCFPPIKWISRWKPFGMMVEGVQKISKPLLVLSIATTFSDHYEGYLNALPTGDDPPPNPDLPRISLESDVSISSESIKEDPRNWIHQVIEELEKKQITLPERMNMDELQRFYDAANGDMCCLLSSLKKTIRWRETYHILSCQELEMWSHLVFWHELDVMLRPCLIIRLGLACSSLRPHERPQFAQAVVSQIEHGVLRLIKDGDGYITVIMDCEGISPFKFPMQLMRYCSNLVQDHYPNRLGSLFVIRLPPVVRVLAQTIIQLLKPATRKKLRIEGDSYQKVLSEYVQSIPAFLGGDCTCSKCERVRSGWFPQLMAESSQRSANTLEVELADDDYPLSEFAFSDTCHSVLRAAIVALLMLCVLVAFLAGMHDPESSASLLI